MASWQLIPRLTVTETILWQLNSIVAEISTFFGVDANLIEN